MAEAASCYKIQGMLKELKTAKELIRVHVEKYGKLPEMSITLKAVEGIKTREHKDVYHLPSSSSQVGAIVNFDSYPLLIPNGDIGYSFTMICANSTLNTLIPCMFYSSLYMEREGVYNYMTKCRRLFQQFVVDNYVKVETARLSFIEFNQNKIRKERADILRCDDGKSTGQRVIIPSSFVGGPRYMKQRQQDALAFVTNYGSPDFLITFTMNPRWEELNEAIEQTDSSSASRHRSDNDRPDLVSRIFKLKVDSIMDDLTNKNIFGRVKAFLYSIEWQKRGLPHVHILLWMEERVNAELVGSVISAEIPDKEKEPRLHDIVTKCMIHGPCKGFDESHVCCQRKSVNGNDKCQKGFPKPCRSDLLFGRNGYPLYRRRAVGEGGHSFDVKVKGELKTIDNSWVVPYNPYLCLKYNAHINVECSNSIKCIAYVTKYVNKGCDRILFSKTREKDDDVNEVRGYQEAHMAKEEVIDNKIEKDTQLTAFFKICSRDEFAAGLYYHEMPNFFVYNNNKSIWVERRNKSYALGRIRAVTSKNVELFYLRLLLTHKRGPKSFTDLRTVDGHVYSTFREAVKAMGLLNDEDTWKQTILEIINHTNDRRQLRATYASMLVFSSLEDQLNISEETKDLFSSDFLHHIGLTEYNEEIYLDALEFRRYTGKRVELWRRQVSSLWPPSF
ncbi:uncharacterized protein LOC143035974 [Oratosquilla oratoria]|uniref:uncharacterized protein LOC143035974 n=1 Tax=Oratosquilla oratoria TaxID=337810 RepID=UPI003F765770